MHEELCNPALPAQPIFLLTVFSEKPQKDLMVTLRDGKRWIRVVSMKEIMCTDWFSSFMGIPHCIRACLAVTVPAVSYLYYSSLTIT